MTINRNLSVLAEGANSSGVLGAANGGTGLSTPGTNGNVLTSNGSAWVSSAPAAAGVTSVTGTAPVVSSGGTTPAISMAAATASVNGYLTSTDWTTFNNKQPSGAYLTTVTVDSPLTGSGTSGSHLAIPAATASVNGYLTSTDWTTFNNKGSGTVTSVTGTSPVVSSGGATPAISIPAATTSVNGYLTSTDWNTFNSKQAAFGSQTANYFYAAPNGSAGVPSFRALVAADVPTLNQSTTGNAATATTATNIASGAAGSLPYQSGAGATTFLAAGTNGNVLTLASGVPSWTAPAGGVTLSNDTATATNLYPTFASATSGSVSTIYTGNANLLYKPSTGELQSQVPVAINGIVVNNATINTSYTIPSGYNAVSAGPVTVASGIVITVQSGSVWAIV